MLPLSIKKKVSIKKEFTKFVVCSRCDSLHNFKDCVKSRGIGFLQESKLCERIQFPRHPFPSYRRKCGQQLLYSVALSNGKTTFHPFKTYCYNSVITALKELLVRPGFYNLCSQWKTNHNDSGLLTEIFDGKVWKIFKLIRASHFCKEI